MTRILLIDAQAGCSGDMFVAAAAPLAGCEAAVCALPEVLQLPDTLCEFADVMRGGLRCRRFTVTVGEQHADHHHAHAHEHRSLPVIRDLIQNAPLAAPVQARAIALFEELGRVEAAVHGIPIESVHFHEVGAIDSIIDIVAAALCIEGLAIASACCTPIRVGHGCVATAHGQLPVPAPATERLLQGLPCLAGDEAGEWCTPTGALILRHLAPATIEPVCEVLASAFGAGSAEVSGRPNALRLRLAERVEGSGGGLIRDEVVCLQCNVDDISGEALGSDFAARLLAAGALDVFISSGLMKKGRPAWQVEVLSPPALVDRLATLVLVETTTIGLRLLPSERLMLPRRQVQVESPYGPIPVKVVRLPDGSERRQPEYAACRRAAEEHGVPLLRILRSLES